MGFKTKKNPNQMCFVDKRALKPDKFKIFSQRTKGSEFRLRKKMLAWWKKNITTIESNVIVKREKNRYFFCIVMDKEEIKVKQPREFVALDPGVRTFQTFYSDEDVAGKIGDNICEELIDIGFKVDKIISKLTTDKTIKNKTRYNLKKRCHLLRTKIRHKTDDLHWKACDFLCSNFKNIYLPSFQVQGMVTSLPKRARVIGSKTVRNMLFLSHYKFKERLIYKAKTKGANVVICEEHYTTKTCGGCGHQQMMGEKKVFDCEKCPFVLDRDYNGARNIFIKNIGVIRYPGIDTSL